MHDNEDLTATTPRAVPWNKSKLIGPKPPLRQKHVWAIRTTHRIELQVRDLALFIFAVDSKLRGCEGRRRCPSWARNPASHRS